MAATLYAVLDRLYGASLKAALPNDGGPLQNLDVLQIVGEGGKIFLNVDFSGVVHNPAVNPTTSNSNGTGNTRLGQFYSRLSSSATTAQLFADAFSQNVSQLDIVQVMNIGGNISYFLNFQGVATGS